MTAHELTTAQLDQIFAERIAPALALTGAGRTEQPAAVMFAAQPGAGKSVAVGEHAPETAYVQVVGDDMRGYHPGFRQLMRTEPANMPAATQQAAGQWVQRGLAWAREQSRSVAWETTLRAPEVVGDLERFVQQGWPVRVVALAVPREVSLAGTVRRYLDQLDRHGAARAAPMTVHDQAYLKGPHALRQIRQQLPTVLVQAVDRAGALLASGDDAAAAIDEAHRRPLTDIERGYVATELAAADAQVADLTQRGVRLDAAMVRSLGEARRGLDGGPDGRQYAAQEGWWRPSVSPSFPSPPQTGPRSRTTPQGRTSRQRGGPGTDLGR